MNRAMKAYYVGIFGFMVFTGGTILYQVFFSPPVKPLDPVTQARMMKEIDDLERRAMAVIDAKQREAEAKMRSGGRP